MLTTSLLAMRPKSLWTRKVFLKAWFQFITKEKKTAKRETSSQRAISWTHQLSCKRVNVLTSSHAFLISLSFHQDLHVSAPNSKYANNRRSRHQLPPEKRSKRRYFTWWPLILVCNTQITTALFTENKNIIATNRSCGTPTKLSPFTANSWSPACKRPS